MQDVDRVAHVQAFPQPARARRSWVNAQALRDVPFAQGLHRIGGNGRRRRHVR